MSGFPGLPPQGADARSIAAVVNRIGQGKLNCTGTATLAANQATTTVADRRATAASHIALMPLTASAAAEIGAGGLYVSGRATGSFVISHANNAETDRQFGYAIIG